MSESKKKNILIGGLLAVVLVMAVGYAAFATTLNITGTAEITSTWDVEITNIEMTDSRSVTSSPAEVTGNKSTSGISGDETTYPTYTATTATFYSNLVSPTDYVEYTVTVKNKGSLPAHLNSIAWDDATDAAASPIVFTYTSPVATDLDPNDTTTLTVRVTYANDGNGQEQPAQATLTKTRTLILDYVQKTNS